MQKCDNCGLKTSVRHDSERDCVAFLRSQLRIAQTLAERRQKMLRYAEEARDRWKIKAQVKTEAVKRKQRGMAYEKAFEERISLLERFVDGVRLGRES